MRSFLVALLLGVTLLSAQKAPPKAAASSTSGVMTGGMGMTWIDGEAYYLVNIAPELSFGKFGVGLDLNLHISSKDQKIRKEDFDETYDYLRIIRYLRYGFKGDEIYVRLGMLDYARLGHGSIVYNYKNSPSVDARRLGAELDLDFGKWGFESVYGDFGAAGLLGMRGYARPLQFTKAASIPVIGALEVGATFATDLRDDAADIYYNAATAPQMPPVVPRPETAGYPFDSKQNAGGLSIIGLDLGLPLLRLPIIDMTLYYDYAKILDFGSGMSAGLETNFSGFGLVRVFTRFERRFAQTDQYLPSYFDSFYELDRYLLEDSSGTVKKFNTKALMLANTKSPGPGYFGSLTVDILGTIQVQGMYQRLDNDPNSGALHLGTNTGEKIPLVSLSAGYDKKNITSNTDMFTLDDRSLLYAEVGYKPYPFMIVSTLYTWTFAPIKDADGNISRYEQQKRITPKVSFVFPL